jgi:hypothetical protein
MQHLLTAWGEHEKRTRPDQICQHMGSAALDLPGAELTRQWRAPLLVHIAKARNLFVHEFEIDHNDLTDFLVYNRIPIDRWRPADADAEAHVAGLAAQQRVDVLLLAAAVTSTGAPDGLEPPFLVFDGLHRLAAWRKHVAAGHHYPIRTLVVGCASTPY